MEVGALSAAGWAWSMHDATLSSGCGWLGVVIARQADQSGWLGATGRCTSTGGVLVTNNDYILWREGQKTIDAGYL